VSQAPGADAAPPPERRFGLVLLRAAGVLALAAGAFAVLRPFLTSLLWAAVLAYLTWPIYRGLRARTRRPRMAALGMTAGVVLGVAVPVAALLLTLASEGTALVQGVREWAERGAPLPAPLAESAWLRRAQALLRERALVDPGQLGPWLGQAGARASRELVDLGTGVVRNALRFVVTVLSLYGFYVNGERLLALARALAPLLFPTAPDRFLERIGSSVSAVVYGMVGTALAQGLLAGVGLALARVPSSVALGTLTALVSFVPGAPSGISLAAAAWLWLGDEPRAVAAAFLAVWAVLVVGTVDNILRPVLISGRGRIPFLLVIFGVVGGVAAFGLIGLLLGPALLVVGRALVEELAELHGAAPLPPPDDAPPPAQGDGGATR
jgi:predicted PurR-regulated permease PerM